MIIPVSGSTATRLVFGPKIQVTRPNNTTAYAAGGVWGDGADARIAIVVPPRPGDMVGPGYSASQWFAYHTRNKADTIVSPSAVLFGAKPATVLGDQNGIALTDSDIALVLPGLSSISFFVASGGNTVPAQLNTGAAGGGRRALVVAPGLAAGRYFTPGATYWMYLWVLSAYTPTASEQLVFFPVWTYPVVALA